MKKDSLRQQTCPNCEQNLWMDIYDIQLSEDKSYCVSIKCPACSHKFSVDYKPYKRKTPNGYIFISIPQLVNGVYGMKQIAEHHYIWEEWYKNPVPTGFILHHINGIKDDNDVLNLIALPKKSHTNNLQKIATTIKRVCCPFCQREFPILSNIKQ